MLTGKSIIIPEKAPLVRVTSGDFTGETARLLKRMPEGDTLAVSAGIVVVPRGWVLDIGRKRAA